MKIDHSENLYPGKIRVVMTNNKLGKEVQEKSNSVDSNQERNVHFSVSRNYSYVIYMCFVDAPMR